MLRIRVHPACQQQQSRCSLPCIKHIKSTHKSGETRRTVEMNNVGESSKRKKSWVTPRFEVHFSVIIVDQLMLGWWTGDCVTCIEECKAPLITFCLGKSVIDRGYHFFPTLDLRCLFFKGIKLHSPKMFPICRRRQSWTELVLNLLL